jgi:hypothetical protein
MIRCLDVTSTITLGYSNSHIELLLDTDSLSVVSSCTSGLLESPLTSLFCSLLFSSSLICYIRQSDGLGDTLFTVPFREFDATVASVFVPAGTALVLFFISVATICYICFVT